MFDIGWSEMMVVGIVALIVVGPKDLPKMFRTVGEFTGKARGMAREFQRAMDAAAKEAGVKDLARDLRNTTSGKAIKEAVGFDEIDEEFRALGRNLEDVRKPSRAVGKSAGNDPGAVDTSASDPALAAERAARNAELSEVERQRLKKAQAAAEARKRAAEIRAEREADEAEAKAWAPAGRRAAEPKARPADPETGPRPSGDAEN
ncbi:MAG: hypothetical protein Kow0013_20580 [Pararhodobacter sp.]